MSYLALARKWRPSRFSEVVGQSHVLTALGNALNQNKLHHAYLFSGTRGVGKTSIGRLFAKGLNCETGITATPCGQCDTCKEIEEGRFVDLLEIDAASRTKVEDTRELLDNVQYKPARGRFKVYLIDEVHMLSRHSFNALLKTLEEPPEYVKFLLATTDPQKLPVTILSRCLQFHLKPINVDNIHEQLDFILGEEQVTYEPRALGLIAHAADGSMRDALSLTDQAIALGNGRVAADMVATMLGTLDTDQAIHLLEAIAAKQTEAAMAAVHQLAANGIDWDSLLQELAGQLHRIAMYQALPATLDKSKPDAEKIDRLAHQFTPQDVQLYYQIALKGRQDLPLAPTERMGLEMSVLRMMAFRPAKTDTATAIVLPERDEKPQHIGQPPQHNEQQPVAKLSALDNKPISPTPAVTQQANREPSVPKESSVSKERSAPTPPLVKQPDEQPPLPTESDYPFVSQEDMQQMYSAPEPEPEPQSSPAAPASLSGLRHQLRSQRAKVSGSGHSSAGVAGKKSKVMPATGVMERVTQRSVEQRSAPQHNATTPVSPTSANDSLLKQQASQSNEPYQWKPITTVVEEEKNELTPTQIKQALQHTKTPQMAEKLRLQSIAEDKWAALISELDTAKLVEQLALNSSFSQQGATVTLTLRPSQAHLNTGKARSELQQALSVALKENCDLVITAGDGGQTPLELREALYQDKLQAAHRVLESDDNVQFIQKRFAAQLDSDSVRPI